jgi:hypothetical protein
MKKLIRYLAWIPLTVLCIPGLQAGTYFNDFNTEPTGLIIRPHSKWVASGGLDGTGYLSITDAINGQDQAGVILPNLDPGLAIGGFNAQFKLRIGGGTCCDAERRADGFSFSFVPETHPVVTGGGIGEEGPAGAPLVISFDTWDNGTTDTAPAIEVKVNDQAIAFQSMAGIRDANRAPAGPLLLDSAGNPVVLRTGDVFEHVEIDLRCGVLNLSYKGVPVFTDLQVPFPATEGRFVLGARTGGANDNHWVDDLEITTLPARLFASRIEPAAASSVPLGQPVAFEITDAPPSVLDAAFRFPPDEPLILRVNGVTVPSDDFTLSFTTDEINPLITITRLEYLPAGGWMAGTTYDVELTFSEANEENRLVCTVTKVFATTVISADTLFIEAEDFNYRNAEGVGGNYFNFDSPAGSYMGLAAVHLVDYFQNNDDPASPEYRIGEVPNVPMATPGGGGDFMRGDTVLNVDYKVGWNSAGEWYNYTRTFPEGTYKVYARLASDAAIQTMRGELSEVTSDRTQPDQSVVSLGTFTAPRTGGWDTFTFVPLRDASGEEAVVRLSGERTLRYTLVSADHDINYFAFVPVPAEVLRPILATATPAPDSTAPVRDPLIRVVISDRDTAVVASSIQLFVNGEEVTASATITDTEGGAEVTYQAPVFDANAEVTVRITFVDDATPAVGADFEWTFRSSPLFTSETLFIEAEDFNYTENGVAGLHADFGDPDGSLFGKGATQGIDYFDNPGNADQPYRAPTDAEAGKFQADDLNRGSRVITANYILGWNDVGEWFNYTRTFPEPAQRYNIYGRVASEGEPIAVELSHVTSDPSQPNQTLEPIGRFNSPRTANWDTFTTVPLRDSSGNLVSVRLGGTETIRATVLPGNVDINWIAFVPAEVQIVTPIVSSVSPANNSLALPNPIVRAVIRDEDTAVVASSLRLFIDGNEVTSNATIIDTESGAMIEYQLPSTGFQSTHSATVGWSDDGTPATDGSFTWHFTQSVYSLDNLFIEAEDFNTDHGRYFPSHPATGQPFNAKGLYAGLDAVLGVDFQDSGNPEANEYRIGELPNVGMVAVNDANVGGAGERPGFELVADYKIGWTDAGPGGAGGDWYNYTRTFPEGTYNVYLRASHGDINATIGGQLDRVTSDPDFPNQTVEKLGTFRAPATGGWDTFTFIPLKDDSGEFVAVPLSGEVTLRYTVQANGGDINYLMFAPAPPTVTCGVLTISQDGAEVVIEWTGPGTLQSATEITGEWSDVGDAESPYRVPATGGQRFFRMICR